MIRLQGISRLIPVINSDSNTAVAFSRSNPDTDPEKKKNE